MTFRHRLVSAAAVAACASILVLPAGAGASPGASFQQALPLASGLCARVSKGVENRLLKHHASNVLADCAVLQSTFTSATTTALAARATLTPQLAAAEQALAAACPTRNDQTPACARVRAADTATIQALKGQIDASTRAYRASLAAGRVVFWRAVEALPGGSQVPGEPHPPAF